MNSGYSIPQLGFGVFQVDPVETRRVVLDALEVGYRHFDTAAGYDNEHAVGEAIAASGIPRRELFVTTKQRPVDQGINRSQAALHKSLDELDLDYVDLYLIHWPTPARGLYLDTWREFEKIASEGLAKSIGVSNFLGEHLDLVLARGGVVPAINQLELHPRFQQRELERYSRGFGIQVEAWSPIARGALVESPEVRKIAEKHSKSVAQLTLRWHIEHGRIVLPRTTHKARMRENYSLFDFELSDAEVAVFDALDSGQRIGPDPSTMNNA